MKNHQGGLYDKNKPKKQVQAYENTKNNARCVVCIFEKYLGLRLSSDPKCPADFYLRPSANFGYRSTLVLLSSIGNIYTHCKMF